MRKSLIAGSLVAAMAAGTTFAQTQTAPAPQPSERQQPASTQPDNRSSRQPSAEAKNTNADHQIVVDAAKGNMAEIELGKVAQEKASRDEVKQFGQKMVADHSKANEELKTLAQSKNIPWPTEVDAKHKAAHDKLAKMSGAAFDRAYMQQMIKDHTEKISKLRSAAQSVKDPEIKAWAQKSLTTPQEHLKQAQSIANQPVGTSGDSKPANDRQPANPQPPAGSKPAPGERKPQ
jgi:putative membrane protein